MSGGPASNRAAGYAVLESDGAIVRLERSRSAAEEVAARLPGRRVETVFVLDDHGVGMNLETIKAECKEIFVDAGNMSVTVNTWANYEGASLMVHGKGPELPLRMAGSFRWEELDAIIVALAAARSA